MLDAWPEGSKIDRGRIGFFGFSRGAYTGLVIAGGRLDILGIAPLCSEGFVDGMCAEIEKGKIPVLRPAADPRFGAAVLADLEFGRSFTLEGLKDVKVPIQLWASERGGDGVLPEDNDAIDENLPAKPIASCPTRGISLHRLARPKPKVGEGAGAFDRAAFHKEFNAAVVAFFRKHLVGK